MVAVDPRMGLMDIALAEIAQGKLSFTRGEVKPLSVG